MRWLEVMVRVPAGAAEAAGDVLLRRFPQGFAEEAGPGRGMRTLRAYVAATPRGRRAIRLLRRELEVLPRSGVRRSTVRMRLLRDEAWTRAWRAFARPVRIGRLLVQPTWIRSRGAAADGSIEIRLDPGMAFGSGEHPSTQLCLAAAERLVRHGATVIDLGAGSGILAIAAARLGARRVIAIDNDPVAVRVARANARRNGVASRVSVRLGHALDGLRVRADLILANLTADILREVVSGIPRRLAPRGRLVASGFGSARVRDVRRRIARAGLRVERTVRRGGWCAVHAVAPARKPR